MFALCVAPNQKTAWGELVTEMYSIRATDVFDSRALRYDLGHVYIAGIDAALVATEIGRRYSFQLGAILRACAVEGLVGEDVIGLLPRQVGPIAFVVFGRGQEKASRVTRIHEKVIARFIYEYQTSTFVYECKKRMIFIDVIMI